MRHVPSVGSGKDVEMWVIERDGMSGGLIGDGAGTVGGTAKPLVDVVQKSEEGDSYVDVHLSDSEGMYVQGCR